MSGVKRANRTEFKTTVSLYLERNLVEKARNHVLNLSGIIEQALSSIPDYLETQNIETSSESLNECSLSEKAPRAGSSAWYECRIRNAEIAGSNPARSIMKLESRLDASPEEIENLKADECINLSSMS
jgi:hypothetical protein